MSGGPLQAGHSPFETDDELLALVLAPYQDHCKYLTSASVSAVDGLGTGRGEFHIPESCYIDDTGHFNSVEFNICFNQLGYYVLAKSITEGLMDLYRDWTLEQYFARQLPDMLIARFASRFQRPIDSRRFYGEFTITSAQRRNVSADGPIILMTAECKYWDDNRGRASGEATLVLVNLPLPEVA